MSQKIDGWRNSPVLVDLLEYFLFPKDVSYVMGLSKWQYELEGSVKDYIDAFIERKILLECETFEVLEHAKTINELKFALKRAGLKQTGKKTELAFRLCDEAAEQANKLLGRKQYLKCAPEIVAELNLRIEAEKRSKAEIESNCIAALQKGEYEKAIFLSKQIVSGTSQRRLKALFYGIPESLKKLNQELLSQLKVAAGMYFLFYEKKNSWLPVLMDRQDAEQSVNHLIKYADIMSDVVDLDASHKVEMRHPNNGEDGCGKCQKWFNKECVASEVPALPMSGCDSYQGCDLYAIPIKIDTWVDEPYIEFVEHSQLNRSERLSVCVLCGAKEDIEDGWSKMLGGDSAVTTVSCVLSRVDRSIEENIKFDICPVCFVEKLIPWFKLQGAEPKTEYVE